MDDRIGGNDDNDEVLKNVYFLRKISIICWSLQSFSLAVPIISYNANGIYYLPIIWSISSLLYSTNFVRNRQYIKTKCLWFTKKTDPIHSNEDIIHNNKPDQEENLRHSIKLNIDPDHASHKSVKRRGLENVDSNSVSIPIPKPAIPHSKSSNHIMKLSIADDVNTNTVNSIPDIDEILNEPLPPQNNELQVRLTKSENNVTSSIPNKLVIPHSSSKSPSLRLRNSKKPYLIPNLSVPILLEDVSDHTRVDVKFSDIKFGQNDDQISMMRNIGFKKNISAPVYSCKHSKLDTKNKTEMKAKKHPLNTSIDVPAMATTSLKTEVVSPRNLSIPIHRKSKSDGFKDGDKDHMDIYEIDIVGTIRSLHSLRGFGFVCAVQENNLTNKLKSYQKFQQKHRAFTE